LNNFGCHNGFSQTFILEFYLFIIQFFSWPREFWFWKTKYHNGGECALGMEAGTVCCVQPDRAPKGVGVPKNWLYYFVEKYFF
jgi:hypothetical protein